jgi:hypothetical protein
VGVFASYDETGQWHGHYRYFPIRWRPSIDPLTEDYEEASIVHPLKEYDHPIRIKHRKMREDREKGSTCIKQQILKESELSLT